jgi:hypothetical protein
MQWARALRHAPGPRETRRAHRDHASTSPPIWLPQEAEPVTLVLSTGEKLPGKVLERAREALVVVIVVPALRLGDRDLRSLVLEYANPGGRVRLSGAVSQRSGAKQGVQLRIARPELIEVVQEREHLRVPAECPVALRASAHDDTILTHTLDISAGGVLLAGAGDLHVGDQLDFQIGLAPGTRPVVGTVEIVRSDVIGRLGAAFIDISHADRWRLIRFTLDCQSFEAFRHPVLDESDPWHVSGAWEELGEE